MTTRRPRPKPPRTYSKHGITPLKDAIKRAGPHGLDQRTKTARAIAEWRRDLINDLGGDDVVTAQQRTIVDLACRSKVLVDSIDAWLMRLQQDGGSLVNRRSRSLLPVVKERQALADSLAKYMTALGLERRSRPVASLAGYIADKYTISGDESTFTPVRSIPVKEDEDP